MKNNSLEETIELPKLKEEYLENTTIIELPKLKAVALSDNNINMLEDTVLIELPRLKKDKQRIILLFEKRFLKIAFIVILMIITFFTINIIRNVINYKSNDKIIENVLSVADVSVVTNDYSNYEEDFLDIDLKQNTDYYKYRNYSFLDVNISELQNINSDTVGWIKVDGTNINYPFLQTNDNDYYLKHSFDKSKNNAGWVFMDYRNDIDNLSQNTIIYAHGLHNGTMFGSLRDTLKEKWFNNSNHIINIATLNKSSNWEIFSVYKVPNTTDYLTTNFKNDTTYQNYLDMITSRSIYNFNKDITINDKILTLSTCYNNDIKIVVHARLISEI